MTIQNSKTTKGPVKIAKENLNKVREQVRKAEEQLQATLILSKEHDQTTS